MCVPNISEAMGKPQRRVVRRVVYSAAKGVPNISEAMEKPQRRAVRRVVYSAAKGVGLTSEEASAAGVGANLATGPWYGLGKGSADTIGAGAKSVGNRFNFAKIGDKVEKMFTPPKPPGPPPQPQAGWEERARQRAMAAYIRRKAAAGVGRDATIFAPRPQKLGG